jgi:hypothetical protein
MSSVIRTASALPSTDTGNITSETQITDRSGNLLTIQIPRETAYETVPLRALVWGYCTSGSSTTLTITIYFGSSSAIGSNASMHSVTIEVTANERRAVLLHDVFGWADEDNTNSTLPTKNSAFITDAGVIDVEAELLPSEFEKLSLTASFADSDTSNTLIINGFEIREAF